MAEKSNKGLIKFLGLLAVGLVIFISVFRLVGFGKITSAIGQLYLPYYLIVIGIIVFNIFLWSYRWGLFIRMEHPEISSFDIFKTTLVGVAINNLTPVLKMGGEAARVYLLKIRHGMRGREGLATTTSDLTMEFIVDFMLVIVSVIFLMIFLSPPIWLYGILLGFLIVSSLIVFSIFGIYTGQRIISSIIAWFCRRTDRLDSEITLAKYETFQETFRETMNNKRVFTGAMSLTVMRKVLLVTKYYVLFAALGHTMSPISIIIAIGVGYMLMIIPSTPGSLGVFEGGMVSIFVMLGVPAGAAAAAVFLDRLIWFWGTTSAGGLLGTYYGLSLIGSKVIESYKNAEVQ
ncbi:MAG: flippase-like domain-containing protein [Candidatus Aenigmatarchaeota archaeon]